MIMDIQFEKEICQYLGIPSIPKCKWDGKQSFENGCAIISHNGFGKSYAVATFDSDENDKPIIKRVFSIEPYNAIENIFVVPSYMETDVDNMDLDDLSKKNAEILINEAKELEVAGEEKDFNGNEYMFDNIKNDEQATAFIKAYNRKRRVKGRVPRTHEGLVMRLNVIYSEMNNKQQHGTKKTNKGTN